MTVTIGLFKVTDVDDNATPPNSTATKVHVFESLNPVRVGTVFEYQGKRYVHAIDVGPTETIFVEEQEIVKVE